MPGKKLFIALISIINISNVFAQQKNAMIKVEPFSSWHVVEVTVGGKPFTDFFYPDSLPKPVLFPIYASNGEVITRGFPLKPRANEATDHPHHIGLWMNYENVNGLDFWNNSYAIPADKKQNYGWIKTTNIVETKSGEEGLIHYNAEWQNIKHEALLQEDTRLLFSATNDMRIIDRITTLIAMQDINMPDVKDGFLGLRVAKELELPSKEEREYADANGIVTKVKPSDDKTISGNYITSEGKQGDSAWGTRAAWCMLYGKKANDTISILIIDHPKNIGYPTYWHARGYGLFAANPLGQKIFSNGKEVLNFGLKKGASVTFRYRVVVNAAQQRLSDEEINKLSTQFAQIQ